MNATLKTIALALLATMTATCVVADEKPLEVTFEFGYNGVVPKSMRLVPVRVRIRNELRNLAGRIEVRQPNSPRGAEVTFVKSIRSPSPSTQVFTLYPRIESAGGMEGFNLEASVIFDDKKVGVFKETVFGKSNKRIVITCGTNTFFKKNVDRRERKKKSESFVYASVNYQFVPIQPLLLPEVAYGYDSVHAIILNGTQFLRLTRKQTAAITQWIRMGGRLLLFHPEKSQPLRDWLAPFEITDLTQFSMTHVGAGLLAIQPFDTVRDLPFWLAGSRGDEAYKFFPELIVDETESRLFMTRQPKSHGGFQLLVDRHDGSTYGFRGFVWLLLIILVYMAFVGPVDWWITKKTKKPWLSWPIFAVLIVVFSILSYWYSGTVQSAPMSIVWSSVLDVAPGGGQSRGDGVFWIRSTGNFDFDIQAEKAGSLLSCRESPPSDKSGAALATIENRQNKPSSMACRIPVFSAKEFNVTWYEDVASTPKPLNGGYELSLDRPIRKAFLASKYNLQPLALDEAGALMFTGEKISWKAVWKNYRDLMLGDNDIAVSNEAMVDYWLGICFGKMKSRNRDMGESDLDMQNEWERSLDRSDYLVAENRILIVFVDTPLNELSVNRSIPQKVGVDCIRYLMPKSTSK